MFVVPFVVTISGMYYSRQHCATQKYLKMSEGKRSASAKIIIVLLFLSLNCVLPRLSFGLSRYYRIRGLKRMKGSQLEKGTIDFFSHVLVAKARPVDSVKENKWL